MTGVQTCALPISATAGRPPRGTEIRILDGEGRDVPTGTAGRIFVRSALLFEGYTDGNTKPIIDGFMGTGDVGRLDADGLLFVEGREDDMIVSGGENVFPGEVEDAISLMVGVRDVAVVGVADDEFGARLCAYVVCTDGSLTEDAVRAWVRDHLARYKVPRDVVFMNELPRNTTGKLLRRQLGADTAG